MEAVSGYVGSGEVVSCSSLLWMGVRGGACLCVTPFNEFGVDGFSCCIGIDGFSGCIDRRDVFSVLLLVRCG